MTVPFGGYCALTFTGSAKKQVPKKKCPPNFRESVTVF
jgi:hypothetical protein